MQDAGAQISALTLVHRELPLVSGEGRTGRRDSPRRLARLTLTRVALLPMRGLRLVTDPIEVITGESGRRGADFLLGRVAPLQGHTVLRLFHRWHGEVLPLLLNIPLLKEQLLLSSVQDWPF